MGLALSRPRDVSRRLMRESVEGNEKRRVPERAETVVRIFDFDRWTMGGLQALEDNQQILLSGLGSKGKGGQVQDLLTLAKINLANARGPEALGFLVLAEDTLPAIKDSLEYRALRGAANAVSGKYEDALDYFLDPDLETYSELDYWKSYTLAWLEDWQQAGERMPRDITALMQYPRSILERLGLKLSEVLLREGDVPTAEQILSALQKNENALMKQTRAGIEYMRGVAHSISGEKELAKQKWEPLLKGSDDFYRVRAGLALTTQQLASKEIDVDTAIDRLEGLRYAWRGDELEARVNYTLGQLYIDQKRYIRGLTILRDAASLRPDTDINREITAYMKDSFEGTIMLAEDLSPLDAVSIFEEFRELTPTGPEGLKLVQRLSERLVEADLLSRAADLLDHQIEYRLEGAEKGRVAIRLATIYLLNREPEKATEVLDIAEKIYAPMGPKDANDLDKRLFELELLRAKALSQLERSEEAIDLLNGLTPQPAVNRLRADIAWNAMLWEDAAEALNDLIIDEKIDASQPLSEAQASMILNRAVSLNLANDRVELANIRAKFGASMSKSSRARLFDIVTRPRQTSIIANQATLQSIVEEVDLFEDFLETLSEQE